MTKKISLSSDLHIRIKKLSTLMMLQDISEARQGERSKINAIINEALEIGLPCVKDSSNPDSFRDALDKSTQRIIMNQNRQTQKIQDGLQKLSVLAAVNESIVGSIIQEVEMLLSANGFELPKELLDDMMTSIPRRFEEQKDYLIGKLIGKNNGDEEE